MIPKPLTGAPGETIKYGLNGFFLASAVPTIGKGLVAAYSVGFTALGVTGALMALRYSQGAIQAKLAQKIVDCIVPAKPGNEENRVIITLWLTEMIKAGTHFLPQVSAGKKGELIVRYPSLGIHQSVITRDMRVDTHIDRNGTLTYSIKTNTNFKVPGVETMRVRHMEMTGERDRYLRTPLPDKIVAYIDGSEGPVTLERTGGTTTITGNDKDSVLLAARIFNKETPTMTAPPAPSDPPSPPAPPTPPVLYAQGVPKGTAGTPMPNISHAVTPVCEAYSMPVLPQGVRHSTLEQMFQQLPQPTTVPGAAFVYSDMGPFGTNIKGGDPVHGAVMAASFAGQFPSLVEGLSQCGFLTPEGKSSLQAEIPELNTYRSSLVEGEFSAASIGTILQSYTSFFKSFPKDPNNSIEKWAADLKKKPLDGIGTLSDFSQHVSDRVLQLNPGETMVIPIGFVTPHSGHAMGLVLRRMEGDTVEIKIVNSGAGRESLSSEPHPYQSLFSHHVSAQKKGSELAGILTNIFAYNTISGFGNPQKIYDALGKDRALSQHHTRSQLQENCYDDYCRELRVEFAKDKGATFNLVTFLEALWRLQTWVVTMNEATRKQDSTPLIVRDAVDALAVDLKSLPSQLISPHFLRETSALLSTIYKSFPDKQEGEVVSYPSSLNEPSRLEVLFTPPLIPNADSLTMITSGAPPITPPISREKLNNPKTFSAELNRVLNIDTLTHFKFTSDVYAGPFDSSRFLSNVLIALECLPPIRADFWDQVDIGGSDLHFVLHKIISILNQAQLYIKEEPNSLHTQKILGAHSFVVYALVDRLAARQFGSQYLTFKPALGATVFDDDNTMLRIATGPCTPQLASQIQEAEAYFTRRTSEATQPPLLALPNQYSRDKASYTEIQWDGLPCVKFFGTETISYMNTMSLQFGRQLSSTSYWGGGHLSPQQIWFHFLFSGLYSVGYLSTFQTHTPWESVQQNELFHSVPHIERKSGFFELSTQTIIRTKGGYTSLSTTKRIDPERVFPVHHQTQVMSEPKVSMPQFSPKGPLDPVHYKTFYQARLGPNPCVRVLDWAWENVQDICTNEEVSDAFEKAFFINHPSLIYALKENRLFTEKFMSLIDMLVQRAQLLEDRDLMLRAGLWIGKFCGFLEAYTIGQHLVSPLVQRLCPLINEQIITTAHPSVSLMSVHLQLLHYKGVHSAQDLISVLKTASQFNSVYSFEEDRAHTLHVQQVFYLLHHLQTDMTRCYQALSRTERDAFDLLFRDHFQLPSHPVEFRFDKGLIVCGSFVMDLTTGETFVNRKSTRIQRLDLRAYPHIAKALPDSKKGQPLAGPFDTGAISQEAIVITPHIVVLTSEFYVAEISRKQIEEHQLDHLIGRQVQFRLEDPQPGVQENHITSIEYESSACVFHLSGGGKLRLQKNDPQIETIEYWGHIFELRTLYARRADGHPQSSFEELLSCSKTMRGFTRRLVGQTISDSEGFMGSQLVDSVDFTPTTLLIRWNTEYGEETMTMELRKPSLVYIPPEGEPTPCLTCDPNEVVIKSSEPVLMTQISPEKAILGHSGAVQFMDPKTTLLPTTLAYVREKDYQVFSLHDQKVVCQDLEGHYHFKIERHGRGTSHIFRINESGEATHQLIPVFGEDSPHLPLEALLRAHFIETSVEKHEHIWVFKDVHTGELSVVLPRLELSFSLNERQGHSVLSSIEHPGFELSPILGSGIFSDVQAQIRLVNPKTGETQIGIPCRSQINFTPLGSSIRFNPDKPMRHGPQVEWYPTSPLGELIPRYGHIESTLYLALLRFRAKQFAQADELVALCFGLSAPLSPHSQEILTLFLDSDFKDDHPKALYIQTHIRELLAQGIPVGLHPMSASLEYRPRFMGADFVRGLQGSTTMGIDPGLFVKTNTMLRGLQTHFSMSTSEVRDHADLFIPTHKTGLLDSCLELSSTHEADTLTADFERFSGSSYTHYEVKDATALRVSCQRNIEEWSQDIAHKMTEVLQKLDRDQTDCSPKDSADFHEQHLHRLTEFHSPISWQTLLKLAALGNLDAYRHYFPHFSERDCIELHQDMLKLRSMMIAREQVRQVFELLNGPLIPSAQHIQRAGEVLFSTDISPEDPIWNVVSEMELSRHIKLRPGQIKLVETFMAPGSDRYAQLTMGGGKTIASIMRAILALDGTTPVIVMTPSSLIPQTMREFRQNFARLGRSVVLADFSFLDHIDSEHQLLEKLQDYAQEFEQAVRLGWPIFCTPQTYQHLLVIRASFQHRWIEQSQSSSPNPVLIKICQSLDTFKALIDRAIVTSDEADTNYKIDVSFILSHGNRLTLPEYRSHFSLSMLGELTQFLSKKSDLSGVEVFNDASGQLLHAHFVGNEGAILKQDFIEWVTKHHFKDLTPDSLHLLKSYFNGNLPTEQIEKLEHLLATLQPPERVSQVKLWKKYVSFMSMPLCYFRDFGPPQTRGSESPQFSAQDSVAVPYKFVGIPEDPGTFHQDPDLKAYLTLVSIYHHGLNLDMFVALMNRYQETLLSPSFNNARLLRESIRTWLPNEATMSDEDLDQTIQKLASNRSFASEFLEARPQLKHLKILLETYFTHIAATQLVLSPHSWVSTSYDLQEMGKVTLAMSGTREGQETWVPELSVYPDKDASAFLSGLYRLQHHPTVQIFDTVRPFDAQLATLLPKDEDVVIVDAGGFLLSQPRLVASSLLASVPNLNRVDFFEDGLSAVVKKTEGAHSVRLYAHANTIGADAKNPSATCTIVTISEHTSSAAFAQAVFRVREHQAALPTAVREGVLPAHRIQVVMPQSLAQKVRRVLDKSDREDISLQDIIQFFSIEDKRRAEEQLFKAGIQQIRHCLVKAAEVFLVTTPLHISPVHLEASKVRTQLTIIEAKDIPIEADTIDIALFFKQEIARMKQAFPLLVTPQVEASMQTVAQVVIAKLPTHRSIEPNFRQVEKHTQKSITQAVEKKVETQTQITKERSQQVGVPRAETPWEYPKLFKHDFFESEELFTLATPIRGLPRAVYSHNFLCTNTLKECEADQQPLLTAHFVVMKYESDGLYSMVVSQTEAARIQEEMRALLQSSKAPSELPRMVLYNLNEPASLLDAHRVIPPVSSANDALTPDMLDRIIKVKIELGLNFESQQKHNVRNRLKKQASEEEGLVRYMRSLPRENLTKLRMLYLDRWQKRGGSQKSFELSVFMKHYNALFASVNTSSSRTIIR